MSEAADDIEHLEMNTFASPPAGRANYFMVLVLASGRPTQFDEIHDLAVYGQKQQFLQPRLGGYVGYQIEGDRVRLSVERIENPRDAANLSGTLALELWALSAPYSGGSFQGVPLAGVAVGSLSGQSVLTNNSFELPLTRPPAGRWHFVLMLREWTTAGYVTRDFTNFDIPVAYEAIPMTSIFKAPTTTPRETAPKISFETVKTVSQPAVPQLAEKSVAPVNQDAPKTSIPSGLKALATAPAKAAPAVPEAVSVNSAPEEQLAAVEGLSPKLARAIVNKRPFSRLDDLKGIKGISAKLLAAIRSRLKL
jgi:DNA uptake protein ComE-like DNA-binding protein